MTTNNTTLSSIAARLKAKRKQLGLSKEEMADDLGLTVQEIEQAEAFGTTEEKSTSSGKDPQESKKYLIEIYDPTKSRLESRELDLFDFEGIDFLFEKLENGYNHVIEFCARIRPGDKVYDEFDKIYYEDNNILEITNIKKVENNANNE